MGALYQASFRVSWSDVDMNGHMANSRYLDYATQTRFQYIASQGFTPADFRRHGIGPIIFEDRIRYQRELRFLDEFSVSFSYEPIDDQGRKFRVVNRFTRDGEEVAEVIAHGAWFDLGSRKVVVPPDALATAMGHPLDGAGHEKLKSGGTSTCSGRSVIQLLRPGTEVTEVGGHAIYHVSPFSN